MSISKKRLEITLLAILIATSIFLRFWKIRDYIIFLGDEGRDMIVLRNIFTEKHIPFLGPTASVGGFYLGPIYYWMAAPFLLLYRFDPVGPAYMVAIIGVATVFLLYKFLKQAVGFWPAILAGFLYSTAPLIVRYSRSSWNPNPLPFFSLLIFYSIYLGVTKKAYRLFIIAGASFGIAIQLHYLASILPAIAVAIIILNVNYKKWHQAAFFSILGFLITFSPFLLFEIRNNFPNFKTILEFVTRDSTLEFKSTNPDWIFANIGYMFFEFIANVSNNIATKLAFWTLTLGGIIGISKFWKNADKKLIYSIGVFWFLGGLAGLRFYTGQLYDYYFGFLYPAPFILFGLVIYLVWHKPILKVIACVITAVMIVVFLKHGFYESPPNRAIQQTATIADAVIQKTDNKPYNFALISERNSDHAYRYFLEIKNHKPTELDSMVTDQLLVVCESKECTPLGQPIWEIAGFGRAEIAGEWNYDNFGIKVIRLVHWSGAPNPAGKPAKKGA